MTTLLDLKSSVLRQVQRSQSLRSRREPPPTPSSPLRPRPEPLPRRWAHSCILPLKFFFFRSRNGLSSTNIPTAFKMKKNQPTEATVVPVFHQPQQQVVNSWRRCVLMSLLWAATLTRSVPRGDVDASLTCTVRLPLASQTRLQYCLTLVHAHTFALHPWCGVTAMMGIFGAPLSPDFPSVAAATSAGPLISLHVRDDKNLLCPSYCSCLCLFLASFGSQK